jgi:hypothetical protein
MGGVHVSPEASFPGTVGTAAKYQTMHPHALKPVGGELDTFNYRLCSSTDGAEICRYDPTSSVSSGWEFLRRTVPSSKDEQRMLSELYRAQGLTQEVAPPLAEVKLYPVYGTEIAKYPVKTEDTFVQTPNYAKWL